jgi:TPP-dependent pyruvate/acetoin dehydrogenase alpha subunit
MNQAMRVERTSYMKETDDGVIQALYEKILTIRRFEEAAIHQYRIGNIRGYLHLYIGQEAIAAGVIQALEADDYIVSTHRGHGHAIAKGHDLRLVMAELFGKETGYCHGRGGSMHVSSLSLRNLGANGIVGGGIPIATGAALALKLRGEHQIVACFFSDGAANNGVFHESLNMAAIYDLPVLYILENNQYAVSTPVSSSSLVEKLSVRAQGYGMPGITVDGNDGLAIFDAMEEPIRRARKGEGPTLIECVTCRRGGHHVNDPGLYMPDDDMRKWEERDPILIQRSHLLKAGLTGTEIDAIDARIQAGLDEAVQYAVESPDPSVEEFLSSIGVA